MVSLFHLDRDWVGSHQTELTETDTVRFQNRFLSSVSTNVKSDIMTNLKRCLVSRLFCFEVIASFWQIENIVRK